MNDPSPDPIIPFYEIDEQTQRDLVRLGAKAQARRMFCRIGSYGVDVSPLSKQPESQTLKDLEEALYAATLPLHGLKEEHTENGPN
jgi:hypothetical protein